MTINLERFPRGLTDAQDAEPLEQCQACGGEIYPGEDVYLVNGHILHNDWDCLLRYIAPETKTIEEALGLEVR